MSAVIQLHATGEPSKPNRSVSQLAKHIGVSFKPADLPLSMIAVCRRIEQLEHELAVMRHEQRPLLMKLRDRLSRRSDT